MSDDVHSTGGTEHCIECGEEIEGEGVYEASGFQNDGAGEDGNTVLKPEFDDGPYCSFDCTLNTEAGRDE